MWRPGGNAIDGRLRLVPRAYLVEPLQFGTVNQVRWVVPAGGDAVSLAVARRQHRLCVALRTSGVSGAAAARRWGVSRQTWSRTLLGERWAGQLVLSAMLDAMPGAGTGQRRQ